MQTQLTPLQRLQAPTPPFFQRVFKVGLVVAAVAAGLTTFQADMAAAGYPMPGLVAHLIEAVGWLSAGIAAISKFAVRSEA